MASWSSERWAASSGIVFAIVLVVANFLAGSPPHYNASPDRIVAFLSGHHRVLVVQAILGGVLIVLFLWFLASFAGMYREAGEQRLSAIVYGAGIVTVCLAAVGDCVAVAALQLRGTLDQGTIAALYGVCIFFYLKLFWSAAALAFAAAAATHRSHVLPQWFTGLSLAGGIVFVLGGLSIRMGGFFSPAGAMATIGFVCFAAWILVSSALCAQRHAESHAMAPALSH